MMSEIDTDILSQCMIEHEDGVLININITPGAKTAGIGGVDKWRRCLEVKVKARAIKGQANKELVLLLSSILSLPSSNFVIIKGERSHKKSIKIFGLSPKELTQRLKQGVHSK